MTTRSFHTSALWIFPLLALVSSCGFQLVFASEVAEADIERELTVTGPVGLSIRSGSGAIQVETGPTDRVRVVATVRARAMTVTQADEKLQRILADPPIVQDGNQIDIGRIEDRDLRRNVQIDYVVTVPATTEVEARVGSGRITIDGVTGPVGARTGSGRIIVSNVDDGVSASTGSGPIELMSVTGDVNAKTGSGRVSLNGLSGGLSATTGSGSIRAEGIPTDEWKLRTGSGRITVTIPRDASFDVSAHSGSGGVEVDHPLDMTGRTSRRSLTGTVRGGGQLVDARTGSGRIRIE